MTSGEASVGKRREEVRNILGKYPDRVPVICEKARLAALPEIAKKKFLVPGSMLCGEFKYIIHKQITDSTDGVVAADQTIYLFIGNSSPKASTRMFELYDNYKAEDGFLHMTYGAENTLGGHTVVRMQLSAHEA